MTHNLLKRDGCGPRRLTVSDCVSAPFLSSLLRHYSGRFSPSCLNECHTCVGPYPASSSNLPRVFFGSGVILATSLIHLLEPAADDELGPANTISMGGCIPDSWGDYPYAFGICLISISAIGITDGVASIAPQPHSHKAVDDDDGGPKSTDDKVIYKGDAFSDSSEASSPAAQILGVAILEFGVVFHSIIIGLTLAVSGPDEFMTLFVVIIFHQMFEGLGLGTRLAFLKLPTTWSWAPFAGAIIYAFVTPLGMAISLGVRESLAMGAAGASISAGILDSISAGILLYTATVELIAHEFIFNTYYHTCSWSKVIFVIICFATGAGVMALLGKWA